MTKEKKLLHESTSALSIALLQNVQSTSNLSGTLVSNEV